jgi:hypothetical protein
MGREEHWGNNVMQGVQRNQDFEAIDGKREKRRMKKREQEENRREQTIEGMINV